jgi:hypothetical protein
METIPDYQSFDSPEHECCRYLTPDVVDAIMTDRQRQRDKARRNAERYLVLYSSPKLEEVE